MAEASLEGDANGVALRCILRGRSPNGKRNLGLDGLDHEAV